jgi:hypothetical protein
MIAMTQQMPDSVKLLVPHKNNLFSHQSPRGGKGGEPRLAIARVGAMGAGLGGVTGGGGGGAPIPNAIKGSGQCAGYTLFEDFDFFKGQCDLNGVSASDAYGKVLQVGVANEGAKNMLACCVLCNSAPKCASWTYNQGMCWLKDCDSVDSSAGETVIGASCGTKLELKGSGKARAMSSSVIIPGGGKGGGAAGGLNSVIFKAPAGEAPTLTDAQQASENLVIGMATKLPHDNFAIFLKSLRQHSSSHIALLINNATMEQDKRNVKLFEEHHVEGVDVDRYLTNKTSDRFPDHISSWHPSSYRWLLIRAYINAHPQFKRVVVVDVRDTLFQGDPFQILVEDGFYTARDSERLTLEQVRGGWE